MWSECAADGFEVCVSALCGCEYRKLNVLRLCSRWLCVLCVCVCVCVFVFRHCVDVSRGN